MNQIGTILTACERFGVPTENIPELFHNVPVFRNPRLRTSLGRAVHTSNRITGEESVRVEIHKCVFANPEEMRDTLAHEVAHIIAGIDAGHGPRWKRVARSLGCTGERGCTVQTAAAMGITRPARRPLRIVARCDSCDYVVQRRRRLARAKTFTHRGCGGNIVTV